MAQYVSKEDIIRLIENEESYLRPYERSIVTSSGKKGIVRGYDTVKKINVDEFKKLPTIDIPEAEWIFLKDVQVWKCSECGFMTAIKYGHCTCGAIMTGGTD